MSRIAVVGTANWDRTWTLPHLPDPGATLVGEVGEEGPGGKGLNVAVALARLGAEAALVACVGDDESAARLRELLRHEAVATHGLLGTRGPTGQAAIWLTPDGGSTIAVGIGANAGLDAERTRQALDRLGDVDAVVLVAEAPPEALDAAARWALDRPRPARVVFSAGPPRAVSDAVWRAAELAVCTHEEALQHTGEGSPDPLAAALALRRKGAGAAVVTLGAEGAVVLAPGARPRRIDAVAVDAVDTTGAGDCFTAALTVALLDGAGLDAAARWAAAAAAVCVTRPGAAAAMPRRHEVEALLAAR
jgi:ribokinase